MNPVEKPLPYPTGEDSARKFVQEANDLKIHPITHLGETFARVGREAALLKTELFEDCVPHEYEFSAGDAEPNYENEQTTILIGHLAINLHESIHNGKFDLKKMITGYNRDTRGTGISPLNLPEEFKEVIRIDDKDYFDMQEAHSNDKTLTVFLQNPGSLPLTLVSYLYELDHFKNPNYMDIVESWHASASSVIEFDQESKVRELAQKNNVEIEDMVELQKEGFTLEQLNEFLRLGKIKDYEEEPNL